MRDTLIRYAEAILLRAAPGLLNLWTLMLIGGWLNAPAYGTYSTVVATAGFIGSLIFGPITSGVVSQHARLEAEGRAALYESSLVSAVLLLAILVAVVGLVAALSGIIELTWVGPVVTFGVYTALQEILHARLRLWAFGAVALSQAVIFVALAWLLVKGTPTPASALAAFACSYAGAAAVSYVLCGTPSLRWPSAKILSTTLAVGGPYTFSTASENGLYLGMRYMIGHTSGAHHLGVFSFCVDLAQRLIGFLINAASFAIVPAAFKAEAERGGNAFRKTLFTGALYAAVLAVASFVAVLALRHLGTVPALGSALFDPVVFAVVSAAVVVNRLKKLVLDPFAMRARRAITIAAGYLVSAPLALLLAGVGGRYVWGYGAELSYLGGYVLAAAVTVLALRGRVAFDEEARKPGAERSAERS